MVKKMSNSKTTYISIISGKGGTGKSLFTAVLGNCLAKEQKRILLVDMDLHVRGLTILLSSYMDNGNGKMSISDYCETNSDEEFSIFRFQECEFIPAVGDISEPLVFPLENNSISFYKHFFSKLKNFAENKMYDIVILDCRSGLDSSIVECVKNSDYTISITEDDDVCLNANMNLVNYFRHKEKIKSIYTIINKGRRIKEPEDIDKKIESIFDFSCLGVIPFDEQIMEDYGKSRFWLSVYDTLYFYGLVMSWDKFQEKTKIQCNIDKKKYNIKVHKKHNQNKKPVLIKTSNIIRIYSYILLFLSAFAPELATIFNLEFDHVNHNFRIIIFAVSVTMIFISSGTFRRLITQKYDEPERF